MHVPIRSLSRLAYKLAAGMRAYEAKAGRDPIEGFHWFELHNRLERGTATADWINGVIACYGEPLNEIQAVTTSGEEWTLKYIPRAAGSSPCSAAESLATTIHLDARQPWTKLATVDGAILQAHLCNQDIILRPQPIRSDGEPYESNFLPLASDNGETPGYFDEHHLAEAISRAFVPIKTVVPSAWTEHVPFLFALFSLIRPRRYVEIGTHHGMSFFAACQAADQLGIGTQCVAVDGWIGDEHAGFYENAIFQEFKANLQSLQSRNSYFIRAFFEHARSCFETGSIDLLHIDGLHTYDSVKHDYETWLPQMSSRGVIIFHDTNVYDRNFGVWRLWDEIKVKHPHFHLPHCHGLGVIYVGTEPSPIGLLLRRLEQDKGLAMVAISIFAGLGAMSVKKSVAEHELKVLSGQVDELRAVLRAVRATTSWRLTGPVRLAGDILKSMRRSIRGVGGDPIRRLSHATSLRALLRERGDLSAHFGHGNGIAGRLARIPEPEAASPSKQGRLRAQLARPAVHDQRL